MCVSETRLKGKPLTNITINDYNFAQTDSVTNAGGVAIYISSKYKFELVQSYNMNLNGCEDLWLEVTVPTNQTSFIIGAVYRHPSSKIETFCEAFINTINLLSKKIFYVLDDINIDISAKARTSSSTHCINSLISCGSVPIITIPTRVTDTSSTVIDHVITNDTSHCIRPGVIQTANISDHYPIFCEVLGYAIPTNKKMHYTFRDKSNFDADRYCTDLNDSIFNFMLDSEEITETNFDDSFEAFVSIIQHTIEKHAPLKRMSRKQKKIKRKPWITVLGTSTN